MSHQDIAAAARAVLDLIVVGMAADLIALQGTMEADHTRITAELQETADSLLRMMPVVGHV